MYSQHSTDIGNHCYYELLLGTTTPKMLLFHPASLPNLIILLGRVGVRADAERRMQPQGEVADHRIPLMVQAPDS